MISYQFFPEDKPILIVSSQSGFLTVIHNSEEKASFAA